MKIIRAEFQDPNDGLPFSESYRNQFENFSVTRSNETARRQFEIMSALIRALELTVFEGELEAHTGHYGISLHLNGKMTVSINPTMDGEAYRINTENCNPVRHFVLADVNEAADAVIDILRS